MGLDPTTREAEAPHKHSEDRRTSSQSSTIDDSSLELKQRSPSMTNKRKLHLVPNLELEPTVPRLKRKASNPSAVSTLSRIMDPMDSNEFNESEPSSDLSASSPNEYNEQNDNEEESPNLFSLIQGRSYDSGASLSPNSTKLKTSMNSKMTNPSLSSSASSTTLNEIQSSYLGLFFDREDEITPLPNHALKDESLENDVDSSPTKSIRPKSTMSPSKRNQTQNVLRSRLIKLLISIVLTAFLKIECLMCLAGFFFRYFQT
jgi:hypothetical protein